MSQNQSENRVNNSEKLGGKNVDKLSKSVSRPIFRKEATVILSVKSKIESPAAHVIQAIRAVCGDDSILSCVPKSGVNYEISLIDEKCANLLLESDFTVDDEPVLVKSVSSRVRVVSFMHLSSLISDDEIEKKLCNWGVELVGPIMRRRYEREDVYDGTRYMKVRFPVGVSSLPYSVGFVTDAGLEYYKVRHDHQETVCFHCLSPEHLLANCPRRICRYCKCSGHIKRYCPKLTGSPSVEIEAIDGNGIWKAGATDVPNNPTTSEGNVLLSDRVNISDEIIPSVTDKESPKEPQPSNLMDSTPDEPSEMDEDIGDDTCLKVDDELNDKTDVIDGLVKTNDDYMYEGISDSQQDLLLIRKLIKAKGGKLKLVGISKKKNVKAFKSNASN
ncbi:hypothetical protein SNE40_019774 [Patella caerulea]|uniref:CCHC-type domain-containing protein n=1 Tax=Patella caerulea TaxID=87958 RepID=A0AAN8J845_PATCE